SAVDHDRAAASAARSDEMSENQRPDERTMRGVIPYVNFYGRSGEAADFYARAFGARDLGRMPDPERPGRYMHLQIEINGGALMMTDHDEGRARPPTRLEGSHLQ